VSKVNKSQKIRELLASNVTVKQIAKRLKVSPNYVYSVQWKANKKKPGLIPMETPIPDFIADKDGVREIPNFIGDYQGSFGTPLVKPTPVPPPAMVVDQILQRINAEISRLTTVRDYLVRET
jgi:hypothetical protein